MRFVESDLVFSPTDLCRFMGSRFASWMDRFLAEHPGELEPDEAGDSELLTRRKGIEHERGYVESLAADGADLATIPAEAGRIQLTLDAMRAGHAFVYQAALSGRSLEGFADLLVKVDGDSDLGPFHYIPRELKLAYSAKPWHVIQLCAYAEMLEAVQGLRPERLEIVLGNREMVELRTTDFFHYYLQLKRAFLEFMEEFDPDERPTPEPGADHGRWTSHSEAYLQEIDHLSQVANIRRNQIKRLEAAGIGTMHQLAESPLERVPRLDREIFGRLRRQARLQIESADRDRPLYEVITPSSDRPQHGLALLPPQSPSDVFFDMEGFPFVEGGLEYLFGATFLDDGEKCFQDWWAHDPEQEKRALEAFVDWIHTRWRADPSMHVYHYAAYEVTALRRLMGRHGTREVEVDQLLRNEVFVDLYTIVRQGVMVGEPSYSIKNLERLFRDARSGEVETATDSIVQYQRWLDSGEPQDWARSPILHGIRDYNRVTIATPHCSWRSGSGSASGSTASNTSESESTRTSRKRPPRSWAKARDDDVSWPSRCCKARRTR